MSRPVTINLSAFLLGLLAAFLAIAAATMTTSGYLELHKAVPVPTGGPLVLPTMFIPMVCFGLAALYLAFAAWFTWTIFGLLRLRYWARYSVLVIGGLITTVAGLGMIVSFGLPFIPLDSVSQASSSNPVALHAASFLLGGINAVFAAIGATFMIYFNLAKVRDLFPSQTRRDPGPTNTITGRSRPVAITVISWFFLVSGPFCGMYAFFQLPGFLFGFVLKGSLAHFMYALFAVASLMLGYGLYRLRPAARTALMLWLAVGILNMTALLTPWGQSSFTQYLLESTIYSPQLHTTNLAAFRGVIDVSFLFSSLVTVFILAMLHRYRYVFTPLPPAGELSVAVAQPA